MSRSHHDEPKQIRGQSLVAKVLDAAIEELALTGYEGLSIERVSERANVNRTTIYRRWPTKSELIRATIRHASGSASIDWDTGSLRSDLELLIQRAQARLLAPGMLGILRLRLDVAEDPELHAFVKRMQQDRINDAMKLLIRAEKRGDLRPDLDKALFLDSVFGILCAKIVFRRELITKDFVPRMLDYALSIAAPTVVPGKRSRARPSKAPTAKTRAAKRSSTRR